jgi:hypothetical protein
LPGLTGLPEFKIERRDQALKNLAGIEADFFVIVRTAHTTNASLEKNYFGSFSRQCIVRDYWRAELERPPKMSLT